MTTETLSDKIVYDEIDDNFQQIPAKDVCEFIKQFKEKINSRKYGICDNEAQRKWNSAISLAQSEIDELAGKELCE